MGLGKIWWLWDGHGPGSLRRALDSLIEGGLQAENKSLLAEEGFGGPFYYFDEKGRQPWDERIVMDRWESEQATAFIHYLSDDAELRITASPGYRAIIADLDGLYLHEARRAAQIFINVALSVEGTRGLVIDPDIEEYGEEFNEIITRGETEYPYDPTVLMAPAPDGRSFTVTVSRDSWFWQETHKSIDQ
jgi:hypothetical protein